MPAGVREALRSAAKQFGKKTEDEAKAYVKSLESGGRLYEECWS
jgi:sulfite reductase alpha subunit-like flavoprotein